MVENIKYNNYTFEIPWYTFSLLTNLYTNCVTF